MKLIIDIPYEAYYTFKCDLGKGNLNALAEIIANGKPYEERPQGEWKIIEHETLYLMGIYQCNKCEYKYICPDEFARNFCPNCGADMRGGDKE